MAFVRRDGKDRRQTSDEGDVMRTGEMGQYVFARYQNCPNHNESSMFLRFPRDSRKLSSSFFGGEYSDIPGVLGITVLLLRKVRCSES